MMDDIQLKSYRKKKVIERKERLKRLFKMAGIEFKVTLEKVAYWENQPHCGGIFLGLVDEHFYARDGMMIQDYTEHSINFDFSDLVVKIALELELIPKQIEEIDDYYWEYICVDDTISVCVSGNMYKCNYELAQKWDDKIILTLDK